MVDAGRLRAILSRLQARQRELAEYAALTQERYLADARGVYASKYLLLTAIEDALAVANHVIASEGYRAPSDYADALRSLREAGVVDAVLAGRLEGIARFRNLLVHQYDDNVVRLGFDVVAETSRPRTPRTLCTRLGRLGGAPPVTNAPVHGSNTGLP